MPEAAGLRVGEGEVLLIRTGCWHRRKVRPWDSGARIDGSPYRLRALAARAQRGPARLRRDQRRLPPRCRGVGLPVQTLTLVAMGMQLQDNQDLEQLAGASANRRRWKFLFVVAPLRIEWGTASATNPIAIF